MKAIENNQIFTEVSSEEAVTINGGLFGFRPVYRRYYPQTGFTQSRTSAASW